MPKVRFCNYGTPPCIPQFGKNPWTATFIRKKSMNYHNSEKNHELPLKLRIWSLKVRIRSCKSKFGLLVAPNSKVLRSPNAVINFKFGQLVGFDPLTNLANTGPKRTTRWSFFLWSFLRTPHLFVHTVPGSLKFTIWVTKVHDLGH